MDIYVINRIILSYSKNISIKYFANLLFKLYISVYVFEFLDIRWDLFVYLGVFLYFLSENLKVFGSGYTYIFINCLF